MSAEVPSSAGNGGFFGDGEFWREGLDRMFFSRCYKTSAILGALVSVAAIMLEQRAVAFGISAGLGMGLFSTWTLEMTARLLFNGGKNAGVRLAIGAAVKLPFMLAALLAIAWAGHAGYVNVFAVIGGILIVHATMLISTVAQAVRSQDRLRERYR